MAREKILTWPNRLTMLRIILVGPFVVMLLNLQTPNWEWSRHGAAIIFLITVLSDGLDGYLARRLHQETPLGRFLDPVADKLLIFSAMILLGIEKTCVSPAGGIHFQFPNWVVVAAIGKDIFVVIGFLLVFLVSGKIFIQPDWAGKSTTVAQMILIMLTLLAPDIASWGQTGLKAAYYLTRVLWGVTTTLAVVTCWDYFRVGTRFVYRQNEIGEKKK